MISKKNVNLLLPIVEVDLQPPSHPFSKGSIYVKVPQITLLYPLKESNLVLQRHAIVVLAIRRRGY